MSIINKDRSLGIDIIVLPTFAFITYYIINYAYVYDFEAFKSLLLIIVVVCLVQIWGGISIINIHYDKMKNKQRSD